MIVSPNRSALPGRGTIAAGSRAELKFTSEKALSAAIENG